MELTGNLRLLWTENSPADLIAFALVFVLGLVLIWIFKAKISGIMHRILARGWPDLDEYVEKVEGLFVNLFLTVTVYLALSQFYLMPSLARLIDVLALAFSLVFIILISQHTAYFLITGYFKKRSQEGRQEKMMAFLWPVLKAFIWIFAFLFFLDNLDIQISGLIAGLGVGGIAIGFASQSIIADIFSYFTILIDKPFETGDFIIVGDFRGIVEHIGIKTTRLKSLSGEQLVFSNADITNSRIQNYQRMERRRINFKFGVTFQTSVDKLQEIRRIVRETLEEIERAELDRVHFHEFGEHSLVFEVIYYVNSSEYAVYMDIQQELNLALKASLSGIGVEFAFPTRTIFMHEDGDESK